MNPIAISLLQAQLPGGSYFIPGSGTSGYAPANFVAPATFKDHQGIGNVDYVINSKHTFSGRYIFEADPHQCPFRSPKCSGTGECSCRALLFRAPK